jgi:alkylhydroperoxidase family enzyme
METCKQCNRPFLQVKPWQEFCCQRCQQDWHLHQRKLARQEKLFDKLARRDHGDGTPEQRQKAREVVAGIVRTFSVGPKLRRRI